MALILAVLGGCAVAAGSAHAALTWSGPVGHDPGGSGSAVTALACPTSQLCAATTESGGEVTFAPQHPAQATPLAIDSQPASGLSCVSAAVCVAVDGAGHEVAFAPGTTASPAPVMIDPGQTLDGVSCVAAGQCVAIDSTGNEVTFSASDPAAASVRSIDPGLRLIAVSCADTSTCAAVDSAQNEIIFNPTTGTESTLESIASGTNELTAITCISADECLAFDSVGHEIITDPQETGTTITGTVDPLGKAILAAGCSSAASCDAIDSAGNAISFTPGEQQGTVTAIDPSAHLTSLSCPSGCVAGDATGHVRTFAADGSGDAVTLIDAQAAFSVTACPTAGQCTAMDNFGDEVTFAPGANPQPQAAAVDPNADIVYGIACPSTEQCTAVDDLGQVVTFDPHATASPGLTQLVTGHALLAVACPGVHQCTAVDDDRYAVTFDPQAPKTSATYTALRTPAGVSLTGIACPDADQCTVLDGAGEALTFDPRAPGALPPATSVLPGPGVAIACPSQRECVGVDADGSAATFDPAAPRFATSVALRSGQLVSLSCPTAFYCVSLDGDGRAVEFNPYGSGPTAIQSTGDPGAPGDLQCPTATVCASTDQAGDLAIAGQAAVGAPVSASRPRITGKLRQGQRLTATTGGWRGAAATGYRIQWERCNMAGRACRAVAGVTGPRYRLTLADAGHRLSIVVTASDSFASATATARATREVIGLPAGPRASRPLVRSLSRRRPRLSVTLIADRWGPRMKVLTVRLPAGLAAPASKVRRKAARRAAGPFLVHAGRRSVGYRLARRRGAYVLTLARTVSRLTLVASWPRLRASAALARAVRRHAKRPVTMIVAVGAGAHVRTKIPMVVS